MTDGPIGVLALQGDFAEHLEMLRQLGVDAVEVRLPSDLAGLAGLIIPGGESTTMARLLDSYDLLEPLRLLTRGGFPTWGTCAGAIMLAERAPGLDRPNLGAMNIGVRRNAFGSQKDSFEADLPVDKLGERPFHAVFIRAPVIEELGADVEVLARLEDGSVVAVRQDAMLATSFHPELTGDLRFHAYFIDLVRSCLRSCQRATPNLD